MKPSTSVLSTDSLSNCQVSTPFLQETHNELIEEEHDENDGAKSHIQLHLQKCVRARSSSNCVTREQTRVCRKWARSDRSQIWLPIDAAKSRKWIHPNHAPSKISIERFWISVPARAIQYCPVRELYDSSLRWTWCMFLSSPNLQWLIGMVSSS